MGKQPSKSYGMEIARIHDDLRSLKKQVDEVLTLLGGSAAYDYKGMRAEFRDIKSDVTTIKDKIAKIEKQESERWSISLKTMPQKIVAVIAFLALVLTIVQSVKDIFTK